MLLAATLPAKAHAASAYLSDPSGNQNISVNVDDEFQIALRVSSISHLSCYDCKIVIDGPGTAVGHSSQGYWFAHNHTVFTGFDEGSEDPEDPRPNLTVATGDNWLYDVNEDGRINVLDLLYARNRINKFCQ